MKLPQSAREEEEEDEEETHLKLRAVIMMHGEFSSSSCSQERKKNQWHMAACTSLDHKASSAITVKSFHYSSGHVISLPAGAGSSLLRPRKSFVL